MACEKSLEWRCVKVMVVVLFLLLVLVQSSDGKEGTRIISLNACTDIKYRFATTRITSHVTNPTNQSRHAVFDITLPNDAFISNFTLRIDNETYPGRVEERGQALRQYGSKATRAPLSSGMVTQRPRETNQFQVNLKVAPFQSVTFNLTYQEILERRLGYYDHVLYIDPGQPVDDLRVDVSIEENRPISYLHVPPIRSDLLTDVDISERNSLVRVERPSDRQAYLSYHPSVRQQQAQGMSSHGLSGLFSVRYDVGRAPDAGELLSVNGYFVHFIAPPVKEVIPKNVLFILDTSTSMMWQKLSQLQDAMRVILNDLNPQDRFALMQFNTRATFWRRELLPVTEKTIRWAMQYVNSLKARGYTNIDSSLSQGLEFFNAESSVRGNNSMIIFLTDGRSTRGEVDGSKILRQLRAQNKKNVTIYGLAFGKDADWPLVKKMASQNEGIGRRIYQDADAALQIQGFYNEVSTLLLTGVQAVYVDSQVDLDTLTATLFPKFFNGSEMVVAGKLIRLNQTVLQVYVQATGLLGQVNLTIVPDPDPVTPGQLKSCGLLKAKDLAKVAEKMWAYLTIRQLLRQRVGEDDELTRQKLKDRATEMALRYHFVTPMTSLVVRKPGAEELAFLHEDASEILDESDTWEIDDSVTSTATTTRRTTTTTTVTTPPLLEESSRDPERGSPPEKSTLPTDLMPDRPDLLESSTPAAQNPGVPSGKSGNDITPENFLAPDGLPVSRGPSLPAVNGDVTLPEGDGLPDSSTVSEKESHITTSTSEDPAPPPSPHTGPSKSSRGGGGGDPHFMVEMTSLAYPLCYDVRGDTGDVFQLLRDPETGLTVNVQMSKGQHRPPGSSRFPVYITTAAILLQDVIAEVSSAHVKVNDVSLQWGTLQSVYFPGVWVMMKNSTFRFALDWNAEIDVTRHVKTWANQEGETFLNVEVQNEVRLSKESTGLLGQFVHKDVRLQKIKKRHGRVVAELEMRDERGGHPHISHGRALLKRRRDPYFRRLASCLMVDSLWSHTLDRPTRFYKVRSLYDI